MTLSIRREAVDLLRAASSGRIYEAGGDGYDDVRRVPNGFVGKRPDLVAQCSTAGVADALRFARELGA